MAHRFLNYMLDDKVAYENFVGYVGYQPPITAIDAQRCSTTGILPQDAAPGRRHARGLRQRQRLPDAVGQGRAAVGPDLGGVPQRLTCARAGSGRCWPSRGCVWLVAFFLVAFYAIVASGSATSPRSTSRCRTGTRWTGTSATSGQALKAVVPGGETWDVFVRTLRLRRRRGRPVAGDRLPGRLVRGAPRRALARAAARRARAAVLDQLPDADVRVDEPARHERVRGRGLNALSIDSLLHRSG